MVVIELFYPGWRSLKVHESSPCGRGVSVKLQAECSGYITRQFYPDFPRGTMHPHGFQCEDLESLSFGDESFDLVITQDVMEHVLNPSLAFAEIGRTLKTDGAHIFTVPLVNKVRPSQARAKRGEDRSTVYLCSPEYHANPIDPNGSLVCMIGVMTFVNSFSTRAAFIRQGLILMTSQGV
jgi:SAM-dependent methyltransferase